MDVADIVVLVGGIALIAFVLWYFFGEKEAATTAETAGVQAIKITVKGGYSPDVIRVKQGKPVRLDFYRDETASSSEQVLFPDFGVAKELPSFQTTPIELTPQEPGEYTWTCGMHMMRGKMLVEPA